MDIFIAVIEDRHTDVDVMPFSDANLATAYARKVAKDSCQEDEGVYENITPAMKEAGIIYHGCYSCEGDNVHVVRKTLDAPG